MSVQYQPADKLIGQVLANRYEILHRLGEGAMGAVYKARHVKMGRPFAVKVLHPCLLQDAKVAMRFEREAELAGRLRHPNVVGVVDVGEVDGTRYMVMDFAEGPDLAQLLVEAPMPAERIIHIVRQMLEGLYHAHERGLIHRDFKPENVIVERDTHGAEMPRIVDFGIAILRDAGEGVDGQGRLTTNGLVLGTPHYMAPEQAVADPIDHRIDLFALGIVIYEMLSGRLPFDGSGAEVARANLLLDPPPIAARVPYLEVDPLLEAFSRRLMAKKRDARPPTAKAARELLDLIERDRRAASELLGIPMSDRTPAATQPVNPQARSGHAGAPITPGPTTYTRELTQPAPGPAAMLPTELATPVAPIALRAPGLPEDSRRPTVIRTPLSWEATPAAGRRGPWLIAGGVLGAAAIAAAVMIATAGEPPPPVPERIAMTPRADPPRPAPAPTAPAPVVPEPSDLAPAPLAPAPLAPAPAPAEPALADPGPSDRAPADPAPPLPVTGTRTRPPRSGDSRPRDRAADTRAPETTSGRRIARAVDTRAADTPQVNTPHVDTRQVDTRAVELPADTRSADTRAADPRPADTRAETRPVDGKAVDGMRADPGGDARIVVPRTGITPRAISDLYYSIPPLLRALSPGESQDLAERFLRHNIQRLMIESQGKRDNAAHELEQIRNEALARQARSAGPTDKRKLRHEPSSTP